jgi:hypothetical protein
VNTEINVFNFYSDIYQIYERRVPGILFNLSDGRFDKLENGMRFVGTYIGKALHDIPFNIAYTRWGVKVYVPNIISHGSNCIIYDDFASSLIKLCLLTEPKYDSHWSKIHEIFGNPVPKLDILQPYFYFNDPDNYLNVTDTYILNDIPFEYSKTEYYTRIVLNKPEHILFSETSNFEYQLYPNNLTQQCIIEKFKKLKLKLLSIGNLYPFAVGNYYSTPFMIYTKGLGIDKNIYVKVASTNIKPFLKDLSHIISEM